MKAEKRVVTLDEFQQNLLINGMNEYRNDLLEDQKPTEDVDDLLLKLIHAPTRKEKRRDTGYDR
jgi:hypothetical protein